MRLQAFCTPDMRASVEHIQKTSPVNIHGTFLNFVSNTSQGAEYVGIIRSVSGNLPHILQRLSSHLNKMAAVMHAGIGRGHRGNPAASLKLESLYCTPVLLSGLGALILKKKEVEIIDNHLNLTLQNLMKLHDKTPHCVTAFLAGSLPGTALVHLRILSNFGMITRKPDSVLHKLGLETFSSLKCYPKSWFYQVREICLMYQLPHPLLIMNSGYSKEMFKTMVKKAVVSYWEAKLLHEASSLPSLKYFQPSQMSLSTSHPLCYISKIFTL